MEGLSLVTHVLLGCAAHGCSCSVSYIVDTESLELLVSIANAGLLAFSGIGLPV